MEELLKQITTYKDQVITFFSGGVGGYLLNGLIAYLQKRLKTLEYTVSHEQVALSADDPIFGNIKTTWQDMEIKNLHVTTVVLRNLTTTDYTDFDFKLYTGQDTLLLSQYTQITGTSYILNFSDKFNKSIEVVPGGQPTPQQFQIYYHNREYSLPVFKRDQEVLVRFLTTVPNGTSGPAVWLDTLHPGVKVKFRPNENKIHGVPVRLAVLIGLMVTVIALAVGIYFHPDVWPVILICTLIGIFAQLLGASFYRLWHFACRVFLGQG